MLTAIYKNVVADFDNEKIVVKTDQEAEKEPAMDYDDQGSARTLSSRWQSQP